jgi:hypothetical protein
MKWKSVLLLNPIKVTSVRPQCENAELRISYKQYIVYTISKIKRDFLGYNIYFGNLFLCERLFLLCVVLFFVGRY